MMAFHQRGDQSAAGFGHSADVVFVSNRSTGYWPALAKQIGEYWQTTVTEGRGRYFANDAVQEKYFYPGCLHALNGRNDILAEVEHALLFMTEMDLCARLVLPNGSPTFGVTHFGAANDLLP
ncbi:MAG: hypothetical protein ACQER3_23905 [Pseudomonadota bacterium]